MKKVLGAALVLLLATQPIWAQQSLSITQVLLYKNGMAYIVRSGQISAPVSLTFHPEDMNDILKSFAAWNPDNGNLYSVGYSTGIPANHTLSRFPFDISKPQTGLGAFLVQVKGAEVRLDHSGKDIQGKLVAVQEAERIMAAQTSAKDYHLSVLLKDGSLQAIWLSDVRSVEFVDPQLRDQLRAYVDLLGTARQDVTREVSVYPVPAPGPLRVAYLQQFPLWKTIYRVDFGAKENRIQGYAQIDNPTGESWENVQVSLLSGAPISFLMDLYNPLYTRRSKVPVPGGEVAAPRQYESATEVLSFKSVAASVDAELGRGNGQIQITTRSGTNMSPDLVGELPSVFREANSVQVGDYFEYQFPFPVRIASRQSALLPFLQKTLDLERLSIFNGRSDRGNARLGARIENNTGLPLESGPVTFFQEGRYAGEAVLDYLPRGDKRLVSYGVDYDILVAQKQEGQPRTTTRLTVNKGVAVLRTEAVMTSTYEIRNRGPEPRILVIEHPRHANRQLKGVTPFESTDGFHRFRVELGPAQSTQFAVPEIVFGVTQMELAELERDQLLMFSGKETPREVREKLEDIIKLQEQIATMQEDLKTAQAAIDTLFRDQERLRENLKALRDTSEDQQLRARYLEQLKKQEDRIDASRGHIGSVTQERVAAQTRLGDLISNLTFGN